jgi:hypothetical protein
MDVGVPEKHVVYSQQRGRMPSKDVAAPRKAGPATSMDVGEPGKHVAYSQQRRRMPSKDVATPRNRDRTPSKDHTP